MFANLLYQKIDPVESLRSICLHRLRAQITSATANKSRPMHWQWQGVNGGPTYLYLVSLDTMQALTCTRTFLGAAWILDYPENLLSPSIQNARSKLNIPGGNAWSTAMVPCRPQRLRSDLTSRAHAATKETKPLPGWTQFHRTHRIAGLVTQVY